MNYFTVELRGLWAGTNGWRAALVAGAVIGAVALGAAPPARAAVEFSMAGGNPQRSGFVDVAGPVTAPEVAWEAGLGMKGASDTQPIVDERGNVYATATGVRDGTAPAKPLGALVSLDTHGNERWRYTWTWDSSKHGATSQLSVPALGPGNRLYMGFRSGWIRCFDRDKGTVLWERNVSPSGEPITSAPLVDRAGSVYVYVRDTLVFQKLDGKTGATIWRYRFADGQRGNASSPALSHDERTVYIGRTGNSVGYLYALDAASGTKKWAWSPESARYHSFAWDIPVVDGAGCIHMQDEENANFYAIRDLGGVHAIAWTYKRAGKGAPRLAAVDAGALYSSYNQAHPVVVALHLDGKEKWVRRLDEGTGIGGFIVTRTALYFGVDGTGAVYALNPRTGDTLWRKQVGAAGGGFCEGLALGPNGTLFAGLDGTPRRPHEATLVALKARP